jgi:hypothetical protein
MDAVIEVNLSDFSDEEIVEYAVEALGMLPESAICPSLFETHDLVDVLMSRGVRVVDDSQISIVDGMLIEKFEELYHRIPQDELEEFLKKYE